MNTLPPLPPHFWSLLVVCLLAFLSLWWILLGSGRAARRRTLRACVEALGQGNATASLQESLSRKVPSPQDLAGATAVRNPLYAIPWLLFIGDTSARVPDLIDVAAGIRAPRPGGAADAAFWHWRRLPSMVAIDIHPGVVGETPSPRERSLWYLALLELAERRKRLPLNGIVLCVSVVTLQGSARVRDTLAKRLRALVHDVADHLRIQLPVYLVVTGLEQLEGYDAVRKALPEGVLAQALGHRLASETAPRAPADVQLDGLFGEIVQRMRALRMALFRAHDQPAQQQAIHAFVEQLRALQPGLRAMADGLFGNGRGPRWPRWRGLYLTAAPSNGKGGAFAQDLFTRFLSSDQPLAHSTRPGVAIDDYFAPTRF